MTMTRLNTMGHHEAEHITLKQLDTYKFDLDYSVTVEVVDIEPTVTECNTRLASRSPNSKHLNEVVPQTLRASPYTPNATYKYCRALERIAKTLSDILCKYYIMRTYTTSKKEWKEIAPYYTELKTYYFNAITNDVTEYLLPQERDCNFIEKFLHKTLEITRKMSDNPNSVTYDVLRLLFSEMIIFTKTKRKMCNNGSCNISSTRDMDTSPQTDPPLYTETSPIEALQQIVHPESCEESPMPIITHVTSFNPHKKVVSEGQCVICAKVTGQICIGCYKRYYCSNVCQTIDWSTHKYECVLPI